MVINKCTALGLSVSSGKCLNGYFSNFGLSRLIFPLNSCWSLNQWVELEIFLLFTKASKSL